MEKRLSLLILGLLSVGCRQQMASQPSFRPLRPSAFFEDERSARPLVPGTVPRGFPRDDLLVETGKASQVSPFAEPAGLIGTLAHPPAWGTLTLAAVSD